MQYVLNPVSSDPEYGDYSLNKAMTWNGYPLVYETTFRANYVVSEIVPQTWDNYTALYNGSANEGGAICYFKKASNSAYLTGRYGNTMTAYWAEDGVLEHTMSNLSARGLDWDNPDGVNISTMGLQECSSFSYITQELGQYTFAKRFYPPYGAKSGFIVAGMREDNLGWEMTNIKLVQSGYDTVPVEPEKAIIMHLDTKSIPYSSRYSSPPRTISNNMNEFKYDSAFNLFVKTPAYEPNDSKHSHIDYISTASAERWDTYIYGPLEQPWFYGHFDHMSGTTPAPIAETGTTYTADGCHIDVL